MARYRKFYELRDELIAQGKKFDLDTLKEISFKDLELAGIGNAADASCNYQLIKEEKKRRMVPIIGLSFEDVEKDKGKWNILDDSDMYWTYYKMKSKPIKIAETPKWRLLVKAMIDLRGNWSDGRDNIYLKKIYELLPEVEVEGIVPLEWCKAVKMNADTFDGEWNDGRIMRDGRLKLPENVAKSFGFPTTDASGNIAKIFGAKAQVREGGYKGSYTELFEEILTPEQKVIFIAELLDDNEDNEMKKEEK